MPPIAPPTGLRGQTPNQSATAAPVFTNQNEIAFVYQCDIDRLKEAALAHPLGRARWCLHHSAEDLVQEMILAVCKGSYFPPHRHIGKAESFHVMEGELILVIFDDDGSVRHRVPLTPPGGGGAPLYRLSVSAWHSLVCVSDVVVYHEVTTGPFVPNGAEFAQFAPRGGPELDEFMLASIA